ncbi:MAG: VWA domain-containing protein [Methanobacterium sp.]
MNEKIVEFSSSLRAAGIPVSIRSTKSAYKSALLIGEDIETLREALACVYVKEMEQREKFDMIFDIIFGKAKHNNEAQDSGKLNSSTSNSRETKGQEGNDKQESRNKSKRLNKAVIDLSKEIQNIYINKRSGSSGESNNKGYKDNRKYGKKLNSGISELDNETRSKAAKKLIDSGYKTEDVFKALNQHDTKSNIQDMSFTDLLTLDNTTLNQLYPKIIDLCQKLGKKIATKRSRRLMTSSKGRVNIRKTMRKNMKHGGIFLERINEKPKLKKMNHFFLSDISASCDWISNWFFCIIYSSGKAFNKARVFEYDNELMEITSALDEITIEKASDKVFEIRKKNEMVNRCSNMFSSFKSFLEQANINKKSYVFILSDCRDWMGPRIHKKPKSADLIANMVDESKRVLILNPEPKAHWNKIDSCVSHYEEAGAEIFNVQSLDQLANLINKV